MEGVFFNNMKGVNRYKCILKCTICCAVRSSYKVGQDCFFIYSFIVLWKVDEVYSLHSNYGIILTAVHKIVDRKHERNNHLARPRSRRENNPTARHFLWTLQNRETGGYWNILPLKLCSSWHIIRRVHM